MAVTGRGAYGPPPVDWSVAASTGCLLASSGPDVSRDQAEDCVRELRQATRTAEGHVRELTGLGAQLPLLPGAVVDRPGWVGAASAGLADLTQQHGGTRRGSLATQLLAGSAGVQVGAVLAFLSARVLGQYDPFGEPGGTLLLVAPNVLAAEMAMDVPSSDFRLWVCLHECTHRVQFSAVPWLRDYFATQVRALMSSVEDMAGRGGIGKLGELVSAARERMRSSDRSSLGLIDVFELLQGPEQRAVFDRMMALSTLLEGHADHVMDAVGPAVVPSVATIRERFTDRRRGGGVLDRVLRALLGVDAKIKQYAAGAAFARQVTAAVGMDGFNAVWQGPETLPTRAEIADPRSWLRRVHG